MSSAGGTFGQQAQTLAQPLDILIGTPQKLMQHAEKGNLFWGDVQYVVLDEADTMFDKGFGPEVRAVLSPLRSKAQPAKAVLVVATLSKVRPKHKFKGAGAAWKVCGKLLLSAPSAPTEGPELHCDSIGAEVAYRKTHAELAKAETTGMTHAAQAIRRLLAEEFPDLNFVETSTLHRGVAGARHSFLPSPPAQNKLDVLAQVGSCMLQLVHEANSAMQSLGLSGPVRLNAWTVHLIVSLYRRCCIGMTSEHS